MKTLTCIFLIFACFPTFGAGSLVCFTEKLEVDPRESPFPTAGDSNQKVKIPLDALGQPAGSGFVQFSFSQSSGGESEWSLLVESASLRNDQVTLKTVIQKAGKPYMSEEFELTLSPAGSPADLARTEAILVNSKIAPIPDQTVYFNGKTNEQLIEKMIATLVQEVEAGKMRRGELGWIQVGYCRLR